jgi:hypothetical protein
MVSVYADDYTLPPGSGACLLIPAVPPPQAGVWEGIVAEKAALERKWRRTQRSSVHGLRIDT